MGLFVRTSFGSTGAAAVPNRAMDGSNPALNGLLATTSDPQSLNSQTTIGPGVPTLISIPIDTAITVSTFWYGITTTSTSPTSAQNFVGIYGARSGNTINLLGLSADQTTNFGLANVTRNVPLTVQGGQSLTLPAGSVVYAAYLFNGTTSPSFQRVGSQAIMSNLNLAAPNLRSFIIGSGATTLPPTLDLSTETNASTFWAGLS
jgi:hypothetical protein